MKSGGAACYGPCWRTFTVRAPATLQLEDPDGELSYAIQEDDFRSVEQLALSPEFEEVVAASVAGTACGGFDIDISMTYGFYGAPAQVVPYVDNCAIGEGKVLADIYSILRRLTETHLECPHWSEPVGFELATDPMPDRPLCWFCYGRCKATSDPSK